MLSNGCYVEWEGHRITKPSNVVICCPPIRSVTQERWSCPVSAVLGALEEKALQFMLHAFCFCVVLSGRKVTEKNKKLNNNVKIPNTIWRMSSHLRAWNQNLSVILGVSEAQVVCEPQEVTVKLGDEWKCEEESNYGQEQGGQRKEVKESQRNVCLHILWIESHLLFIKKLSCSQMQNHVV